MCVCVCARGCVYMCVCVCVCMCVCAQGGAEGVRMDCAGFFPFLVAFREGGNAGEIA